MKPCKALVRLLVLPLGLLLARQQEAAAPCHGDHNTARSLVNQPAAFKRAMLRQREAGSSMARAVGERHGGQTFAVVQQTPVRLVEQLCSMAVWACVSKRSPPGLAAACKNAFSAEFLDLAVTTPKGTSDRLVMKSWGRACAQRFKHCYSKLTVQQ